MATFLLTWNPDLWPWSDYGDLLQRVRAGEAVTMRWSVGGTKQVQSGDKLYLLRQRKEPLGIVASGTAEGDWYEAEHWDDPGDKTTYIDLRLDRLVDIDASPGEVLATDRLASLLPDLRTATQRSGTRIDADIALGLDQLWNPKRRRLPRHDDIPEKMTRDDVLRAIDDFDRHGLPPTYGPSTDYDLVHEGRAYPPKAITGLASARLRGRMLFSSEFSSGDSKPCFRRLRDLGFSVEPKEVSDAEYVSADEVPENAIYVEGSVRQVLVNTYERNAQARKACIQHHGCVCVICGFDFEAVYGTHGSGYIHVHHLKQISEIGETYELDPVEDLVPVCPNCHAMLHRGSRLLSPGELRAMLSMG